MVPVVLVFLVVFQVPGPEIRILQEISSPDPPRVHQYQNPLGGFWWYRWFWCFWWFSRSLALKFGFYKKFPRQIHPGSTSTKTHSGDSGGTGGSGVSGGFPGPWP